jgi:hypothetical protein
MGLSFRNLFRNYLESHPSRELNNARSGIVWYARVQDLAKRGTSNVCIWIGKFGVVEDVEEFSPDFQRYPLGDSSGFRHSQVDVHDTGPAEKVPRERAVCRQTRICDDLRVGGKDLRARRARRRVISVSTLSVGEAGRIEPIVARSPIKSSHDSGVLECANRTDDVRMNECIVNRANGLH